MGSYITTTTEERKQMLASVGLSSMADLYSVVPKEALLEELNLPSGLTEMEVAGKIREVAGKNNTYRSIFRGAGAYNHYIPSIVKTVTTKEEFVTAYTPYQAEISQGVLQSIFEYQTQICELTGMDVSNASVYDGAVAAAEAVFMCQERKKTGVILSESVDPQVREVIATYCESRKVPVTVLPMKDYALDVDELKKAVDDSSACVYVQSPNYYGVMEDVETIVSIAHEKKAKVIMGVNPISLGIMKTPGEYDADVAVGEGQPLGMPLSFGGPYLGFMACKKDMMRKLPGRIVGQTVDAEGKRAFVLTLQAREQHIRREKASSNICSNEALCAMTASVYLASMGPEGLRRVSMNSASHAHYLAEELGKIKGFELKTTKTFFHEFVTGCPIDPKDLNAALAKKGILGGLPVEGGILWCATELNTKADIDELIKCVKEVCA